MDRRTFLATASVTGIVAIAGCFEGTPDYDVGMTIDSFRPESLTVEPNSTVTFLNTSSHSHNVVAFQDDYPEAAEYWSSDEKQEISSEQEAIDDWYSRDQRTRLGQGDSFEYTFEHPGRYGYYCVPHIEADMTGEIIVEE